MERVREAIAFNAELADESILLLLTSQMRNIAFIAMNSGLVPLIVGVCAQILYFGFEIIGGLRSHLLLVFFGRKTCRRKKQLVQDLSYRLLAYTYTCVLCTHIRIYVCRDAVHPDSSGPPGVSSQPGVLAKSDKQ